MLMDTPLIIGGQALRLVQAIPFQMIRAVLLHHSAQIGLIKFFHDPNKCQDHIVVLQRWRFFHLKRPSAFQYLLLHGEFDVLFFRVLINH